MNTIESNRLYFHRHKIKGANTSRIIQQIVGWPSTQALKEVVGEYQIRNCLLTIDNANK